MSDDILTLLKESGAFLEGHFLLTSGKHSNRYIEKFRLMESPETVSQPLPTVSILPCKIAKSWSTSNCSFSWSELNTRFLYPKKLEDLPDELIPPNPEITAKGLFLLIDKILFT